MVSKNQRTVIKCEADGTDCYIDEDGYGSCGDRPDRCLWSGLAYR